MEDAKARGGVGYSDKINESIYQTQAPAKPSGSSLKYMLFLIPLLVFLVLWRTGLIQTWLFAVLAVLGAIITLPPILKERRVAEDKTYDGTIASVQRLEPVANVDIRKIDPGMKNKMIFHTIRIQDEAGKTHTYERTGALEEDYRTYYQAGDRVRHHKGFALPEKYDKSADEDIVCIVCGRMNAMDSRRCGECGATLLK